MQHPDEGTIHAWLDGALDARESAELEAHVATCTACAAAVAEARGLIAGASRVLSALDDVPAGVIPAAAHEEREVVADVVPLRGVAPRRRFRVSPAWMAAAAVLVVAVGSLVTMSRSGAGRMDRLEESVARDMRTAAAPQAPDTSAATAAAALANEALATSAQKAADSTRVARSRTAQPLATPPSSVPSPQPPTTVTAAPQKASDEVRGEVAARTLATAQEKRAAAVAPGAVSGVAADARAGNLSSVASLAGCYEIAPDTTMGFARPEAVQRAPAPAPSRAPAPAQGRAAERVSDAFSSTSMLPARFQLDTAASTLSPNARAVVAPLEGGTVRGFWVQFARDSARVVWTSRERPPLTLSIAPSGVRAVTNDGAPVSLRPCPR